MRTVLGAIYGGLVALIGVFALDILVCGVALSPEGELPSWTGPVRIALAVAGIGSGIAIGAWRGRLGEHKETAGRNRRRVVDE